MNYYCSWTKRLPIVPIPEMPGSRHGARRDSARQRQDRKTEESAKKRLAQLWPRQEDLGVVINWGSAFGQQDAGEGWELIYKESIVSLLLLETDTLYS